MMEPPNILVVDDDPGIRDVLCEYLERHGFTARPASGAAQMDLEMAARRPDLIVLDVMMPGEDGLSICRRLAAGGPPVIMLSAMGEDTDRIVGLELGAADYLAKPCNPRELLARVRAVLRRRQDPQVSAGQSTAAAFGPWRLDLVRRELQRAGEAVSPLSAGEFHLLRVFLERPGRVLSRDQLLDLARGPGAETFDRAIDVQISRLRRKLDDGSGAEVIATVRGEGYRFVPAVRRL